MKKTITLDTDAVVVVAGLAVCALNNEVIPAPLRTGAEAAILTVALELLRQGVITREELHAHIAKQKARDN